MSKAKEIASGFGNLLKNTFKLSDAKVEEVATARAAVCQACEFGKDRTRCGKCGCVLAAKVRSMNSSCPINLW